MAHNSMYKAKEDKTIIKNDPIFDEKGNLVYLTGIKIKKGKHPIMETIRCKICGGDYSEKEIKDNICYTCEKKIRR